MIILTLSFSLIHQNLCVQVVLVLYPNLPFSQQTIASLHLDYSIQDSLCVCHRICEDSNKELYLTPQFKHTSSCPVNIGDIGKKVLSYHPIIKFQGCLLSVFSFVTLIFSILDLLCRQFGCSGDTVVSSQHWLTILWYTKKVMTCLQMNVWCVIMCQVHFSPKHLLYKR